MPRGGNNTQPIESCWNSMLPSWTAPAGVNYDGRAPLLRASNSRVFASVTSASPYSLPLRRAGLLLLSRHLCLDGFLCPIVEVRVITKYNLVVIFESGDDQSGKMILVTTILTAQISAYG